MVPGSSIYQLVHVQIPHVCEIINIGIQIRPPTLRLISNASGNVISPLYPAISGISSSTGPPEPLSIYSTASIASNASTSANRSIIVTSSASTMLSRPLEPKKPLVGSQSKLIASNSKAHSKSNATVAAGSIIALRFETI